MARKQAKLKRDNGERIAGVRRHGARVVTSMLLLGLIAWAGYTLYRPATFPVRHVQLTGELGRLDKEQLRQAILPYVTNGFLRVDVSGVRGSLEALPWVHDASVRRVWPDVVEVEIHEQKPLARWGNRGLVNEEGRLFAPPEPEWPTDLPVFEGPTGTEFTMASRYRELREVLSPVGLKVALLSMNDRRAFTLDLENGMRVLLGRSEQQSRLERFVRAYPQVMEGRAAEVRQVDLRYTNGFSVIWNPSPQA